MKTETMDTVKEGRIRKLFIVALIFLPIQYAFVGIIGELESEPWPAFVFPGFKNVYSVNDSFEITHHFFNVYPAGSESAIEVRPEQMFSNLPLSQVPGFMRTHFQEPESIANFSEDAGIWLYQLAGDFLQSEPVRIEVVTRVSSYLQSERGIIFDSILDERIISIAKPENGRVYE